MYPLGLKLPFVGLDILDFQNFQGDGRCCGDGHGPLDIGSVGGGEKQTSPGAAWRTPDPWKVG